MDKDNPAIGDGRVRFEVAQQFRQHMHPFFSVQVDLPDQLGHHLGRLEDNETKGLHQGK